jgi:hypothetical protein
MDIRRETPVKIDLYVGMLKAHGAMQYQTTTDSHVGRGELVLYSSLCVFASGIESLYLRAIRPYAEAIDTIYKAKRCPNPMWRRAAGTGQDRIFMVMTRHSEADIRLRGTFLGC